MLCCNPSKSKGLSLPQTLAYTWLEVGQLDQAQIAMNKVPTSELSPQGNELYLRLNFASLSKPSAPETNPDYIELLSAEKGLRLGSFLSFVEQQANRLSSMSCIVRTWVANILALILSYSLNYYKVPLNEVHCWPDLNMLVNLYFFLIR